MKPFTLFKIPQATKKLGIDRWLDADFASVFDKQDPIPMSVYKIIIIGDSGVGKSAIMRQLADEKFDAKAQSTIGVDFCYVNIKTPPARLQIWDTAGQERFKTITQAYYRGSDAIIIVFDVTRPETFGSVRRWVSEARERAGATTGVPAKYVLVGNKKDLDAGITFEMGKTLADELGMPYFETSAKDRDSVTRLFAGTAEFLAATAAKPAKSGTTTVPIRDPRNSQTPTSRPAACC
jgi:Ras-related protein Rab-8A